MIFLLNQHQSTHINRAWEHGVFLHNAIDAIDHSAMEAISNIKLKCNQLKQRRYFSVRFLKARKLQGKKKDGTLYKKHKQTTACQK